MTIRYRKIAAYGAMASLPWIIIEAYYVVVYIQPTPHHVPPLLVAILVAAIIGIPMGTVGALVLFRIRNWIRGNSKLFSAVLLSLVVLGIFLGQFSFGSLLGFLIWLSIVAYIINSDLKDSLR